MNNVIVNKLFEAVFLAFLKDVNNAFSSEHLPVVFDNDTNPEYFVLGFEVEGYCFERSVSISQIIEFEIGNRALAKGVKQTELRAFADSLRVHVEAVESAIKRLEVSDDH